MTHLVAKFPSIMNLETRKQVVCFQNTVLGQAQDKHSYSKRKKLEGIKGHWSQASSKSMRENSTGFQGLEGLL